MESNPQHHTAPPQNETLCLRTLLPLWQRGLCCALGAVPCPSSFSCSTHAHFPEVILVKLSCELLSQQLCTHCVGADLCRGAVVLSGCRGSWDGLLGSVLLGTVLSACHVQGAGDANISL